jgi:uncharacterized protein
MHFTELTPYNAWMIRRDLHPALNEALADNPAVALLGPRQAGKTTLARQIGDQRNDRHQSDPIFDGISDGVSDGLSGSIYLDLESPRDRQKLHDPEAYLLAHEDKLVILDEVQHMPKLFQAMRSLIDDGRRKGLLAGRFLLLGSASGELLRRTWSCRLFKSWSWMLPCKISSGCAVDSRAAFWPAHSPKAWVGGKI